MPPAFADALQQPGRAGGTTSYPWGAQSCEPVSPGPVGTVGLGLRLRLFDFKVHTPFILPDYIFIESIDSKLSISVSVYYGD